MRGVLLQAAILFALTAFQVLAWPVVGAGALPAASGASRKAEIGRLWRQYLDAPPAYAAFTRRVERCETYDFPDFTVECYRQANGPDSTQRVMMAVPKHIRGKAPCAVAPFYFPEAMLAFNPADGSLDSPLVRAGTNLTMYAEIAYMADLARRGYITVSADAYYLTYARASAPSSDWNKWRHVGEALARDWPGWTGIGKLLFDTRLLVDLAAADARVDTNRIGIIGHSLGGKMAFYAGCLDDRIKAIVASDFGLGWTQTNWQDVWYWGARAATMRAAGASHADLLSLTGGKPFCLIGGFYDDADSGAIMRQAKGYEKCPERLEFIHHGRGHRPPPEATEAGYRFLDRWCRGDFVIAEAGRAGQPVVVLPPEPDPAERHAAEELVNYVRKMTGVRLEVACGAAPKGRRTIALSSGRSREDGFAIRSSATCLSLRGFSPRGTLYAVYEILERFGGCAWYAPWRTVVPQNPRFAVPADLDLDVRPAFLWRQPSWYAVRKDPKFAARCRLNGETPDGEGPPEDPKYGGYPFRFVKRLYSSHTFYVLVPPDVHFKDHPDWFSMVDGRRVAKGGQLCLSNPAVIEAATRRALELAAADPTATVVGVSQMDWDGHCACAACRAIVSEEGSVAGPIVRFVNAVAERLARVRPELQVETLVYQKSLVPPKKTRPRHNVMICCCVNGDYTEPFEAATRATNLEWKRHFEAWAERSPNIVLWDYTPNFAWHHVPHPTAGVFAPNLRYYLRHGVKGIYMDGLSVPSGDFGDLKCWLLAKLCWDPNQDAAALTDRFFRGCYGAAAPMAKAVYAGEARAYRRAGANVRLPFWCDDRPDVYTDRDLDEALACWRAAEGAVQGDADALFAVRMAKYSSVVLKCMRLVGKVPLYNLSRQPVPALTAADRRVLEEEAFIRREAAKRGIELHHALKRGRDAKLKRDIARLRACASTEAPASRIVVPVTALELPLGDYSGGEWNERTDQKGTLVDAPSAVGGKAFQLDLAGDGDALTWFFREAALDADRAYRVRLHLKAEGEADARGEALRAYLWDAALGQRGFCAPQISALKPGWNWVDVGTLKPTAALKLVVKPPRAAAKGTLRSVQVGAIEVTPAADAAAQPVWVAGAAHEMYAHYGFAATFAAKAGERAVLNLSACSIARVWVNGAFAGYGPARAPEGYRRVDAWPIGHLLRTGENTVAIEVSNPAVNQFYLPEGDGFVQAEVVTAEGRVLAATGRDFKAKRLDRLRKVPRMSYQRAPAEFWRVTPRSDAWRTEGIRGECLALEIRPALKALGRGAPLPDFTFEGDFRPTVRTRFTRDAAKPMAKIEAVSRTSPEGPLKGFREADLEENIYAKICNVASTPVGPAAYPARLAKGEGVAFRGAFMTAGFPHLELVCTKPAKIYLMMDDRADANGLPDPLRMGGFTDACGWQLLAPGEYTLDCFEPYAFSAAHLIVDEGEVSVRAFAVRSYGNPEVKRAHFKCADPAFEKIFEAAKRSLAWNAPDCFMDCPGRERGIYFGDTAFTALGADVLLGDATVERTQYENYALVEKFRDVPEGMVPQCYPADVKLLVPYWIANHAFWSVIQLEGYLSRSGGDRKTVDAYRPKAEGIRRWAHRYRNADGLLEDIPGYPFVEWSEAQNLVAGVSFVSNMYYVRFLEAMATLYGLTDCALEAERLRVVIRAKSFNGTWFTDNLTGRSSELCQYAAFIARVATPARDPVLWKRLVEDFGPARKKGVWPEVLRANMLSGYSLRMILLSEAGCSKQVLSDVRACCLPMAELTGTLWEGSETKDVYSCCHGFPSMAAWLIARDALGVREIDRKGRRIAVDVPKDIPLAWCEGTLPVSATEHVTVAWRRAGGAAVPDVRLPPGWTLKR